MTPAQRRAAWERAIRSIPATDSSQDGWVPPLWYWLSRPKTGREAKNVAPSSHLEAGKVEQDVK
jgi:hypothetical protein